MERKGDTTMRNVQANLYRIGRTIINWILLGIYGLFFIINSIRLIINAVNGYGVGAQVSGMISCLILASFVLVLVIWGPKWEEEAKKAPLNGLTPVILLMVFGFLSWNYLFLVGGVFGIISASQEKNESKPEEKQEEKKEEKAE